MPSPRCFCFCGRPDPGRCFCFCRRPDPGRCFCFCFCGRPDPGAMLLWLGQASRPASPRGRASYTKTITLLLSQCFCFCGRPDPGAMLLWLGQAWRPASPRGRASYTKTITLVAPQGDFLRGVGGPTSGRCFCFCRRPDLGARGFVVWVLWLGQAWRPASPRGRASYTNTITLLLSHRDLLRGVGGPTRGDAFAFVGGPTSGRGVLWFGFCGWGRPHGLHRREGFCGWDFVVGAGLAACIAARSRLLHKHHHLAVVPMLLLCGRPDPGRCFLRLGPCAVLAWLYFLSHLNFWRFFLMRGQKFLDGAATFYIQTHTRIPRGGYVPHACLRFGTEPR